MENLKGNLREFEEICEEIIQNEVSLGGSPTINGTLDKAKRTQQGNLLGEI